MPAARQDRERAQWQANDRSDHPRVRALVIEDTDAIADLVRSALEGDGMAVEHAVGLRSARFCLEGDPPDVVVVDVALPNGSGLELLRDPSLGAEDYVVKPFHPASSRPVSAGPRAGAPAETHRDAWKSGTWSWISMHARSSSVAGSSP